MKREKRDVSNSWELHGLRLIHLPSTSVVIANKRSVQLERTNIAFSSEKRKRAISRDPACCFPGTGSSALGSCTIISIHKCCLLKWNLLWYRERIPSLQRWLFPCLKCLQSPSSSALSTRKSDHNLEICRKGLDKRRIRKGCSGRSLRGYWLLYRWSCWSGERTGCDIDENEWLNESSLGCKI